ncbi:hypothetical protein F7D01_13815 [Erythrobacter sp. 3-20A1M]|uniref:hypothetical protein n=1 Tax=Erythrobacter sp. 3-20A1M TaxID=2653850 RepID=UPI001BFC0AC5|nr:hypothetical protein [Erythrobacter sp. 3-20A1M]QWC57999.1 hypothetical protein F7D01_13815 [Erythrobacter sp. 3-20A1M]
MAAIFFLDHPVEFEKWRVGDFRLPPKAMREYIAEHPKLINLVNDLGLKAALDKEYGTLSKAVHGSDSLFRMTSAEGNINIANPSAADLGKWSARERSAVDLSITALAGVLSDFLEGAKMQNLRAVLGVAVQPKSRAALRKHLNISIPEP